MSSSSLILLFRSSLTLLTILSIQSPIKKGERNFATVIVDLSSSSFTYINFCFILGGYKFRIVIFSSCIYPIFIIKILFQCVFTLTTLKCSLSEVCTFLLVRVTWHISFCSFNYNLSVSLQLR